MFCQFVREFYVVFFSFQHPTKNHIGVRFICLFDKTEYQMSLFIKELRTLLFIFLFLTGLIKCKPFFKDKETQKEKNEPGT